MSERCGIVTLTGRPNVGKSSLLNALTGHKLSIVSHKPQTTRHAIQGVLHDPDGQIVFVDTPGLHLQAKRALNRAMNDAAVASLQDVDLVIFVLEALRWTEEDEAVLARLRKMDCAMALVINKVDRIEDKTRLLPWIKECSEKAAFEFVVPVSARKRDNLSALRQEIIQRLPEGPALYPPDMVAGFDNAFLASELVREKLTRTLHQELPYSLTVSIESYEIEGKLHRINAVIWVERDSQKKIVVGQRGSTLKQVGSAARRDLERALEAKVFLQVWCRVRNNWSDDPSALRQFGLDNS